MIGTDEMSSTGMDISESFRAEDLSKTDFFDFVTAPDMGIGIGVSLHTHHHHHHHTERTSVTHLNNGGNARCGPGDSSIDSGGTTNNNSGDPTLQSYDQFWNSDKDHSRLESTIFEDLDRYCWQQHQQQQQHQLQSPSQNLVPNLSSPASPIPQHLRSAINANISNSSQNTSTNTGNLSSNGSSSSISHSSSTGATSTINNTDGQIYTITVLNGNEPWLKREPDTQLSNSLDLECLLGNFPGYIKTEYPYDDSGFSTDGTKDNNDANSIAQSHLSLPANVIQPTGQTLPSLVTALSATVGTGTATTVDQQFSQFQNNNNDWQMTDNNAEQNSAESLLRSALQGKGYAKGLHLQNGLSLVPTSPSVKNDEIRRMLFSTEADSLDFADSTLSASQMFDDNQNATHNVHNVMQSHASTANGSQSASNNTSSSTSTSNVSSIIVDDMFLSLESAFSDDFEKIKRIANEVQQFCSSTPIVTDYAGSDVLMQISPNATGIQQMHSPTTPICGAPPPGSQNIQQVTHPPPQPLKPEVTTSTSNRLALTPPTKITKKYKRPTSSTSSATLTSPNNTSNVLSHSSNNNNNSNSSRSCNSSSDISINKNISSCSNNSVGSSGGSSSSTSTSNSSGSPTHCNGQRKERSLHYCSICSKGFKDKYSVNVHIRTHTGEKPFACSLCGKSFRQKAHLAKHYQTHMAQKSNGNLVKSASSKHNRSTTTALSSIVVGGGGAGTNMSVNSAIVTQQQRQLNVVSTAMVATAPTSIAPANVASPVLPPANGLIANR